MPLRARLADIRRRHDGGADERGAMSVEAVLVLPVFLLIVFTIINGAVWLHAGNIAQSAASSAYNAARLFDATSNYGVIAASPIAQQPGSVLSNAQVSVNRTATTVTVTVTGTAPTLVPGFNVDVERTVSGPTERWVDE